MGLHHFDVGFAFACKGCVLTIVLGRDHLDCEGCLAEDFVPEVFGFGFLEQGTELRAVLSGNLEYEG